MNRDMRHPLPHESIDTRIGSFAAERHGVFTFDDAIRLGATPDMVARRIKAGRWIRIYQGVYCLAGVPATWCRQLLATCRTRAGTVASHRAAAALHGLSGFQAGLVEVTGPRGSRLRADHLIFHQAQELLRADVTVVEAIPVTSVARTLIDLAGLAARGKMPAEAVAVAFDDAVRSKKASLKWIETRVKELRSSGRPGTAIIEELLEARKRFGVPHTLFETRALHMLESAGFPRPLCQYEVFDGDVFVGRVDFAYPHIMLAIEADSFAFHSSPAELERDRERSNALQSLGWDVLHLTWNDLDRPERFLRSLGRYLRAG